MSFSTAMQVRIDRAVEREVAMRQSGYVPLTVCEVNEIRREVTQIMLVNRDTAGHRRMVRAVLKAAGPTSVQVCDSEYETAHWRGRIIKVTTNTVVFVDYSHSGPGYSQVTLDIKNITKAVIDMTANEDNGEHRLILYVKY